MLTSSLADAVDTYADNEGIGDELVETDVPGLFVIRARQPSAITATLYQLSICLILQGSKETSIGDEQLTLAAGQAVVVSHMVPVVSQIVQASRSEPYVALILALDIDILRSLVDEVPPGAPVAGSTLKVTAIDNALLDVMARLFALNDKPEEQAVMTPLIKREMHFRLLMSEAGSGLRALLDRGSAESRITRAIAHVKEEFAKPLAVTDLASVAGMSLSTFHARFKAVTSKSPLQFQKDLRLLEARRLLTMGTHNVSTAAFEVGYESPTQFSREYTRKFGVSPKMDRPTSPD